MAKSKVNASRDVRWYGGGAVRLRKKFGTMDKIEFIPEGQTKPAFALPQITIDHMIAALLELKVLMKGGGRYNSGVIRLRIEDGSGVPYELEDLNESGRHEVRHCAEQLMEEVDDFVEKDDEDDGAVDEDDDGE